MVLEQAIQFLKVSWLTGTVVTVIFYFYFLCTWCFHVCCNMCVAVILFLEHNATIESNGTILLLAQSYIAKLRPRLILLFTNINNS